jgi:hypothetical protein
MTFGTFKSTVSGLLIGDNKVPSDDAVVLALLDMAFHAVGNRAKSLHLLTLNKDANILRLDEGDYLTRLPVLPSATAVDNINNVVLDIDHELCFPSAYFVASYITSDKNKYLLLEEKANALIREYNDKVQEILKSMADKRAENV